MPRRRQQQAATTRMPSATALGLLALLAVGGAWASSSSSTAATAATGAWGVPSLPQHQHQQQHQSQRLPGFLARRGGFFSASAVRAGRLASAAAGAASSSRWLVQRRGGAVPPPTTTTTAAAAAPSASASATQPSLQAKLAAPTAQEGALYEMLMGLGQGHLFEAWPGAGEEEARKHAFFQQVAQLDGSYPGGIAAYVGKARRLLAAAVAQANPFEGMTPSVPDGETLAYGTPEFSEAERAGLAEAGKAAFVLVAGGLGERLGYGGIKLALPVESTTGATYLEFYASFILALQARARALTGDGALRIPLVIMTSDDTDAQTRALLSAKQNFGMAEGQVVIVKQDKVPALQDAAAHLALSEGDPYTLDTKPHGHGDVHHLLLRSGLTERWVGEGRKWVFFLQDTNALVVNSVLPALAVSAAKGYDMNSICIPRQAGEASGAITKLTKADGSGLIINVEYNQLDPLLRATTYPDGDTNDPATGCSPFPGNANNIVFALPSYHKTLQGEDQGVVEEFVNPKFKDASRTAFTKPTRLECMMQDFPKLLAKELGGQARIGFTSFEKWLSFSPAKNSLDAGAKGIAAGVPAATASSAEMEFYKAHALKLQKALGPEAARLETGPTEVVAGIPLETGPRLVLSPSLAVTTQELREKLGAGGGLQVSGRSTLVLDGAGIRVESLDLDGTLVVKAGPKARVTVRSAVVRNGGWRLVPVGAEAPEEARIRGFVVNTEEGAVVDLRDAEGDFVVTGNGEVVKE